MLREMKPFAPRLTIAAGLAAMLLGAGGASATVVFSDDFEDADLDNNGWQTVDTDVNFDQLDGTWSSTNPSFPNAITEVSNPGIASTGLRWHNSQGFTGDPIPKPRCR